MSGKEVRRDAPFGRLPRDGLGAVLAELKGRVVILVGPRTSRTVEAIGFVRAQQQRRFGHTHLFANGVRRGAQRTPAAGGTVVFSDSRNVSSFRHASPRDPLERDSLPRGFSARCQTLSRSRRKGAAAG